MPDDALAPAVAFVRRGDPHLVSDLEMTSLLVSGTRCLTCAPLTDAVRTGAGGASLALLMTMVDVGASDPAMVACRPDWTATQDLGLHGAGPLVDGPVVVDSRLVRAGSKAIVVEASVYDGRGLDDFDALRVAIDRGATRDGDGPALSASGLVTFARIPGAAAPGMADYDPAAWIGEIRPSRAAGERPSTGAALCERMGLQVVDAAAGRLELARTPYVANSIGTINGGALAVLAETAAEAMRPGTVATDMQIHYLSQVKAGPARTVGTVLRDATGHTVVRMRIVDAGTEEQLIAVATVTLRGTPGTVAPEVSARSEGFEPPTF